jgi:predicted Zn finger-like uncharacterized protein
VLITTCTHCLARFRVTPAQLNSKQGQVRCGHCHRVFSGFEALERFPDDDTGSRILAARAAAGAPPASGEPPKPAPFDSIPLDQLPEIRDDEAATEPATIPEASAAADADVALDDGGPIEAQQDAQPPEEPAQKPRAAPARANVLNLLATEYAPAPRPRPSRAWSFGVALLAVLLGLQVLYAFRAQVAQGYPVTRPWLESACATVGCRVPWVNDPQMLKLEDSELLEVPGRPSEIALGARIRNLAPNAQEFPHVELTLTDLSGQAAARRVLRPADYLGRAPVAGEVMAAGSELAIQLRLETPRIKATGYELLLFYPQGN